MPKARKCALLALGLCGLLTVGGYTYHIRAWAWQRSAVAQAKTEGLPTGLIQTFGPAVPPDLVKSAPAVPSQGTTPSPGQQPKPPTQEAGQHAPTPSRQGQTENRAALYYDLNPYVLSVIKNYPVGKYPYLLNNDYANYNGVTEDISYQGRLLLKAHPSGSHASHCSGITFEVFFRAMQKRNKEVGLPASDFNGMTWDELHDFMLTWYAANGNKVQSNIAVAVEKYGIGHQIHSLGQAKAGDFVDISRENWTGHTVVLINWIWKEGSIIGLRYWSSQGSTNGIDYKTEYFNLPDGHGQPYGNIMVDNVYIARIGSIAEYRSTR